MKRHETGLLNRAIEILKEKGPMKAKKLSEIMCLENARSLSMLLQWSKEVELNGGKWAIK